jgi:hypothetical protein
VGIGNLPGISNGDSSPVKASNAQTTQSGGTVSTPITGGTLTFGGAPTLIPWGPILGGAGILAIVLIAAALHKKRG